MKTYLLIFTLAILFQTSFLPINLVLVLLVARSFVVDDKLNYILAFYSGIILGILSPINLGFWSLIFLGIVKLIQIFKLLPFSQNVLTILPSCLIIVFGVSWIESQIFGSSINWINPSMESFLIIPSYIVIRFWEERFVVSPGIKLRMKN